MLQPDSGGNRFSHQRIERGGAGGLQHRITLSFIRTNMAGIERLKIKNHLIVFQCKAPMIETHPSPQRFNALFARAWLAMCAILAIHISDEAANGFLNLWNPTVTGIRQRHPWLIVPTFTFPVWIALLILAVIGFLSLTPWVRRGLRWTMYASYAFISLMLSNGLMHLGFSIYKGTWMPGAYYRTAAGRRVAVLVVGYCPPVAL